MFPEIGYYQNESLHKSVDKKPRNIYNRQVKIVFNLVHMNQDLCRIRKHISIQSMKNLNQKLRKNIPSGKSDL